MEQILVTGSKGAIGMALGDALIREGFTVKGFDIMASGKEYGDITHLAHLHRAMEGCTGVIHLAAATDVADCEDPTTAKKCWDTNVSGTQYVLAAAADTRPQPWFVFASSREVYGWPDNLIQPVKESVMLKPTNNYGLSKRVGEGLVNGARERGELRTAIVRLANVYGMEHDHKTRVIPTFVRRAFAGLPLLVDDLDHTLDFVHIDDVVRGLLLLVAQVQYKSDLPTLNFASGRATQLGWLAKYITDQIGSPSKIQIAGVRPFDTLWFKGDITLARDVLDWTAQISLEEGLTRLI